MTTCLISFPSRAVDVADDEWELVGRESHAVVRQASDEHERLSGGFAVFELPSARRSSSWRRAHGQPVATRKRSGLTVRSSTDR